MLARMQKSMKEKDQGFTLIELLVVIIIIGILAAIAIPVFLNQRKKGVDASLKSRPARTPPPCSESYVDRQPDGRSSWSAQRLLLRPGGTSGGDDRGRHRHRPSRSTGNYLKVTGPRRPDTASQPATRRHRQRDGLDDGHRYRLRALLQRTAPVADHHRLLTESTRRAASQGLADRASPCRCCVPTGRVWTSGPPEALKSVQCLADEHSRQSTSAARDLGRRGANQHQHYQEKIMLARMQKSMKEKDQGFTLIELLVVIIIIGILAAIAIPVFLNQRKKGVDASPQVATSRTPRPRSRPGPPTTRLPPCGANDAVGRPQLQSAGQRHRDYELPGDEPRHRGAYCISAERERLRRPLVRLQLGTGDVAC